MWYHQRDLYDPPSASSAASALSDGFHDIILVHPQVDTLDVERRLIAGDRPQFEYASIFSLYQDLSVPGRLFDDALQVLSG
jgi:hypothetical protein